jgi:hypothetical protein
MNIVKIKTEDLIPYVNNPRNNENAVDKVASSIAEFGFKNPIFIDKNNVVVNGHTRLLASKKLGLKEVPVIVIDDLTETQVKAFRIADNKTSEYAEWNEELLKIELEQLEEMNFNLDDLNIDYSDFGLEIDLEDIEEELESDNVYTKEINIPHYEITGECPLLTDLVKEEKTNSLIERINNSNIPQDIKDFLIKASYRHLAFNYQNIAEYYAHADKDIQELMEESALVIIDYDNAIRNGYVQIKEAINEMIEEGVNNEE